MFNNVTPRYSFDSKLPMYEISCRLRNAMFDILQEILQSRPFLMSQNFEMQGCQLYGVKRIKSVFVDRRVLEQG